ncbi:3-isopropylmalate dehydratase small subunit [Halomonas sp. HNIBRBA4712]|uniref:3-isopropylmalate dehydratase small subunit n=1 Tax=Halomonas sp. HNIBRBA4712 TaxID=3373087 RepID=UPI0037470950
MKPIEILTTTGVGLPHANVDTDQLIPARFMKEPRSVGYGQFLLFDVRRDAHGAPSPDYPLNQPGADEAEVLVSRRNFGAGSSREAAVYALVDGGFRCVIAPSFGDIFASNAVNNGLLPAVVDEKDAERLLAALSDAAPMTVDLIEQRIRLGDLDVAFTINPVWRTKLLNGWDDIDMTRQHEDAIHEFAARYHTRFPWVEPPRLIGKG